MSSLCLVSFAVTVSSGVRIFGLNCDTLSACVDNAVFGISSITANALVVFTSGTVDYFLFRKLDIFFPALTESTFQRTNS